LDPTETVARDPLVIVFAVLALTVWRLIFCSGHVGRVIVRVVLLILITIAFVHADIVTYRSLRSAGAVMIVRGEHGGNASKADRW
jgi:hypothetical protein